jgi:hypothetical protein
LAAAAAGCLVIPFQVSAASPGTVVCPQDTNVFTGTARELVVPAQGFCEVHDAVLGRLVVQDEAGLDLEDSNVGGDVVFGSFGGGQIGGSTIGHDVVGTEGNDLHLERVTIGHDLTANAPITVQTGRNGPDTPGGTVHVGHDIVVSGTPEDEDFVFDHLCNAVVGHDVRWANRSVTLGIGLGGNCPLIGQANNIVGHDLVVTGVDALSGFFGPSSLVVGGNTVGHDLVFTGNTAVAGGSLDVDHNRVGHDAVCSGNTPPVSGGANLAGHANTCG